MSRPSSSILQSHTRSAPKPDTNLVNLFARGPDTTPFDSSSAGPNSPKHRDRLWELSTNLHCSVIGTCLSTADLRSLLSKLGDPKARTASEHDLHGQAVSRAGRKESGGKLLHKLLDRRHEREIARFGRVDTTAEVRALWREAIGRGEIPGAYWAVLTHPATDHALVQEAFGEVHMLSHLVGRAVRADLRRLADLEGETIALADRIRDLEGRNAALVQDKIDLASRLDDRPSSPSRPDPDMVESDAARLVRQGNLIARLGEQVRRAETHMEAESNRRQEAERALRALAEDVRRGAEREATLVDEVAGLESLIGEHLQVDSGTPPLAGLTLVYVGGRPRQVAQARLLVDRLGGRLLSHDGGQEDTPGLLAGLASRADAVMFPVDCVSHDAVGWLKRACRERAIPLMPLRSASLAAIVAALASLRPPHVGR